MSWNVMVTYEPFFFFLRNVQERQKLKQASYRLWWQQDISDYLPNTYTNAHLIYI